MDKPFVDVEKLAATVLCYSQNIYRRNGVWDGPDPMIPIIPLFLLQLTIAILATRLVVLALRPFNQPPFVGEILSGIILGPSVFGGISSYTKVLYPNYSFRVLEPLAHFGLCYYAFLTGLQMDIKAMLRTGTKAANVAVAGIIIPFAIGSGLYFMFKNQEKEGSMFWGAALAATGFPVLTNILEKQRLIHTDMGKTAMSATLINDLSSWLFLGLGLAVRGSKSNSHWTLLCTSAFILFSVYYLRQALVWIIGKTPEGQAYSEFYICVILSGVLVSGVITDACGTHPIIGAFVYGLVIPNQVLEAAVLDKIEDFVMGVFMPVFYVVCGLRTNFYVIAGDNSWLEVVLAVSLACSAKVLSTLVASLFNDMSSKEAVAVGVLTNTKSIMVMIILEIAQTQTVLSTQAYSLMVLNTLLMTISVTPITIMFRPSKDLVPYSRRTIQKAKLDEELRILACIHTTRNIPSMINLLTASNPTLKSPISAFALQLLELIGRASATLVVHTSRRSSFNSALFSDAQVDQIISAFDNFEQRCEGVTTQTLTARAGYSTMDEDICNIATDKRATFIILPFQKIPTIDGNMEEINPAIRSVNEGVLANAPCSVGILIDRGRVSESHHDYTHKIAMLYFGGPDDREGLAYAWRMAEHPDISLEVVRFIPGEDAIQVDPMDFGDPGHVTVHIDMERETVLDDGFLNKFNIATANDNSISYSELVLNDEEEAIKAIKSMDNQDYDLYIVGKGRGILSPLTAGLADWCDCPELGAIGDLLVNSEFESAFSVLVVQQFVRRSMGGDGSVRSAISASHSQGTGKQPSITKSEEFESLSSFRRGHDH